MRRPSVGSATTVSGADYLVCPGCGCGQLQPPRRFLSRLLECDFCECAFDDTIVETLKQIVALPEALGKHSCECGHPEMRRLPEEVFHCPACRAKVLPVSIPAPRPVAARRSLAAFERIPGSKRTIEPGKTALIAHVTEPAVEVVDGGMERFGGKVVRRPVYEVEAEIVAAEVAARAADEEARRKLREERSAERKEKVQQKIDELKAKLST